MTPSRLTSLLLELPLGERASILMAAVSFRPSYSFEPSFRVGPIRAAFASHWELFTNSLVPTKELKAILFPPVRIGTVLEFNKFDYLQQEAEVEDHLATFVRHLQRRLDEVRACRQRSLFAIDAPAVPQTKPCAGTSVAKLSDLVESGRRFATIYADPPWPYNNVASRGAAVNHYSVMSLDAICEEPVRQLTEENAHLHLWTTNAFLRQAFAVIEAWGFEFKSSLVWVKDELGMGNYWRVSHEYLLLGVRGNLTFRERTLPSWILAQRTVHSHKPARIRTLIERVSPGPYLELYGREELPNSEWTVFGNQVERRLF